MGERQRTTAVACLYLVLTLALTYPLSTDPSGSVLQAGADTDLFLWTLSWNTHALTSQPLSVFDANIYYPQRHTLAYSENLIGSTVFAAPSLWLTGNPVLAMNVVALTSCALCGLGAYVLARKIGMGAAAAFIAGTIFAFAPPRFFRLGQLHLTTVQWMPFGLAYLHAYLDARRSRDLRLAVAFFVLQAFTSGHGAVFLMVAMLGLVLFRLAMGEPVDAGRRVRDLGLAGAVGLLLPLLVFLPYRSVQEEVGLRRSLQEAEMWAPNAASFLASPTHLHARVLSRFPDARINQTAKAFLFPGYLALLLAGVALVAGHVGDRPTPSRGDTTRRRALRRAAAVAEIGLALSFLLALYVAVSGPVRIRYDGVEIFSARSPWRALIWSGSLLALRLGLIRWAPLAVRARVAGRWAQCRRWRASHRQDAVPFYALLTALTVWLALGPPGGLWQQVYDWPGFSLIRVPSRFTIVALLGVAVLAAIGFERLTSARGQRVRAAAATVIVVLLIAEYVAVPLKAEPFHPQIASIDRWLDSQAKPFAVAEVPLADPRNQDAWEKRQGTFMLHSMAHWQKTVHGYSGTRPPLHVQLYEEMTRFPDAKSLASLAELGVDYVVVHVDAYPPGEWTTVERRLEQFTAQLRLVHSEGAGRVYAIATAAKPDPKPQPH